MGASIMNLWLETANIEHEERVGMYEPDHRKEEVLV